MNITKYKRAINAFIGLLRTITKSMLHMISKLIHYFVEKTRLTNLTVTINHSTFTIRQVIILTRPEFTNYLILERLSKIHDIDLSIIRPYIDDIM